MSFLDQDCQLNQHPTSYPKFELKEVKIEKARQLGNPVYEKALLLQVYNDPRSMLMDNEGGRLVIKAKRAHGTGWKFLGKKHPRKSGAKMSEILELYERLTSLYKIKA